MRLIRIPSPVRNATSWFYLAGAVSFWSLSRLFEPRSSGAAVPGVWLPPCPLKALSGIPCPFCGLTTGSAWLARGQWREAWASNILSPVLLLLFAVLVGYTLAFRFLAGRAVDWEMSGRARRGLRLAGGLLIALSWLVNLFRTF